MARLVVLRFENDEDTEDFVAKVNKTGRVDFDFYDCPTVEGMYQTPTKFHEPDHRSSGWYWGKKHHWQICHDCGMPSVGYANNHKAIVFDAINLLEEPSKNTAERMAERPKVNPETGVIWEQE